MYYRKLLTKMYILREMRIKMLVFLFKKLLTDVEMWRNRHKICKMRNGEEPK